MRGLIMFDRSTLEHPIVGIKNPLRFAAWCWMLSSARYKDGTFFHNGHEIELKRGQFVCGRVFMAKSTGMTQKQVRVFLDVLERSQMCLKTVHEKGQGISVVTICNYEAYQDYDNYRAKVRAKVGPGLGQGRAKVGPHSETPDETPEGTPELGQMDLLPPKKTKPAKRAVSIPENWVPNDANVAHALSKNFSHEEIRDEADKFRDHHLAKGTTFKDWNAGWRTWVGNAIKFRGRGMAFSANSNGHGQGGSIASIVARREAQRRHGG